jgi:hypothetical protein
MGLFSKRRAFNVLYEADSWLKEQSIEPSSVKFSAYHDSDIVKYPGATVLVGMGKRSDGKTVGFVLRWLGTVASC